MLGRVIKVERFTTAEAGDGIVTELRALLDAAFEGHFDQHDWSHSLGGHHVAVRDGDRLVAHASVVPRTLYVGERALRTGYLEAVATAPERQHQGLGTRAMTAAAEVVRSTYELGALSTSAPGFYRRLGWESWQGPTYVVTPTGRVRTADEDDGVMVLRFGPTVDLDLTAPIACESRLGDDW